MQLVDKYFFTLLCCGNFFSFIIFLVEMLFYPTALHCTALHCTALHFTALHCTALHCTALHCTALHCTALHCTALWLFFMSLKKKLHMHFDIRKTNCRTKIENFHCYVHRFAVSTVDLPPPFLNTKIFRFQVPCKKILIF
jgi:hypothetical protein